MIGHMNAKWLIGLITRYGSRLRFPQLFAITAALFAIDLVVPDIVPFADEVLLALGTLLLGSWQKTREDKPTDPSGGESPNPRGTGTPSTN